MKHDDLYMNELREEWRKLLCYDSDFGFISMMHTRWGIEYSVFKLQDPDRGYIDVTKQVEVWIEEMIYEYGSDEMVMIYEESKKECRKIARAKNKRDKVWENLQTEQDVLNAREAAILIDKREDLRGHRDNHEVHFLADEDKA